MHFLKLTQITKNFKEEKVRETILINFDKIVSVNFDEEDNEAIIILVEQRANEYDGCVVVDME